MILYECLSGRRAHQGSEYNEILYRILHLRLEPIQSLCPGLEPGLCRVVDKAIALAVAERFGDAWTFARALRSFADAPSHDDLSPTMGSSGDELNSTFSYRPPRAARERRGLTVTGGRAHWTRWCAAAAWFLSAGFLTPAAADVSHMAERATLAAGRQPPPATSPPPKPPERAAVPAQATPAAPSASSARSKPLWSGERGKRTQVASKPIVTTAEPTPELQPETTAVRIARDNPYLPARPAASSTAP